MLAGDEVLVSKSGKQTYGLDRFFSSLINKPISGISFFTLSLVSVAALGGRRFIGNPKQPTVSVYTLIDGEYQVSQFRGSDACGGKLRIISPTFPELNLTVEQIFQAGRYPV